MKGLLFRFFKQEKAQALVEFALALPILLALLWGIIEFGRIINAQMVISNLAREGARFGAVGYNDSQISAAILADHASLEAADIEVEISPSFGSRVKGQPLTVTVNYSVELLTPIPPSIVPNPVPLSSECTMRVE